jgi:hypothetical protein
MILDSLTKNLQLFLYSFFDANMTSFSLAPKLDSKARLFLNPKLELIPSDVFFSEVFPEDNLLVVVERVFLVSLKLFSKFVRLLGLA